MEIRTHAKTHKAAPHSKTAAHRPTKKKEESAAPSETVQLSGKRPGGIVSSAEIAAAEKTETARETVRPDVKAQIDEIKELPISSVKATTRGMPRMEVFTPEAPHTIGGQRYQFDFERGVDDNIGIIVDVESDRSGSLHCRPVKPGETEISGAHISFLHDPKNSSNIKSTLNGAETRYFLESLYGRFQNAMTETQAERANLLISSAFAVFGKDGGKADAVQSIHRELSRQLTKTDSDVEGWTLRGR